jgi:predicted kinase
MMSVFTELVPKPSSPCIAWSAITEAFAWFRRLEGCMQDAVYHAEGDVLVHTRMVCEALVTDEGWRQAPLDDRGSLFWAALLHDVAKPDCTRLDDDGRITSRGHSLRGQFLARQILWRMGVPFGQREQICHLITHHQQPFYLLERSRPERKVHEISLQTRCDLLAALAEADARGRTCADQSRLFDNVELFRQLCRDEGCYSATKSFASPHSRFQYFRKEDRAADYEAFDDTRVAVTLLSGLPASGKDNWIAAHANDGAAVISLDALRAELGISPAYEQGPVIAEAKARARRLLGKGMPLIWNATNVTRSTRGALIDLFAAYGAKVTIVYIEAGEADLTARNAARAAPVPTTAIARMLERWQPPDLTECHELRVELT